YHGGLARRRGIVVLALAPAMAGPVEQDDAMMLLEPIGEREPHVLEIAARAVQQHDRRIIVGGLRPLVDVDHMQPRAADLHEAAGRRMSLRNPACADD